MSKLDWFVIGLVLGPFVWAIGSAVFAVFKNAFTEWLKDRT